MQIKNLILDLTNDFEGRLNDDIIFDVKDYINHNEPELAFDVLFNQLYEYDIPITEDEWTQIDVIGKYLKYDQQGYDWSFVRVLIKR